jgi:hypothetical protein
MKKSDVFPSDYYNSGDVKTGPILLTINHVRIEPVGNGNNISDKCVASFREPNSKKLVVTSTKFDAIAMIASRMTRRTGQACRLFLSSDKRTTKASSWMPSASAPRVDQIGWPRQRRRFPGPRLPRLI